MMVLDYDKFSRDDPIGEINIPLCEVDFSQTFQVWKDLNPISKVGDPSKLPSLVELEYQVLQGKQRFLQDP